MKIKFTMSNYSTLILTTLCLLAAVSGQSAVQFFNGTNAVLNWDSGTTLNWGNVTGGPYNTTWANGNDAVFQGTAATVTNLGVSANSVTFSTANYVINSNSITLTSATPRITNTVAATIGASIAGTAGFTKYGSGTLTLSGSNTFTGPLTNNAGSAVTAIVVANSNALSATTVCVGGGGGNGNAINVAAGVTTASGSTMYLQAAGGTRAALGNNGAVTATWGGDVVATAPDNSVLGIFANGGTMNILGNIRGSSPVAGLLFRGLGTGYLYGNIWMTNSTIFIVDGSATQGAWTIYSNSNLWNTVQINGGTLRLGTNDALCTTGSLALGQGNANTFVFDMNGFNQSVPVVTNNSGSTVNRFTNTSANPSVFTVNATAANSRLAPNGTENIVVGGLISFVKNGSFQFTLGGANTYTGTNTINGGTLAITNGGTMGNTANPLFLNAGTLNLGGSSQTVGDVSIANGTITNGTLTGNSFTVQGATVYAALAGSGVLNKSTSGTLTLAGVNTYSGATTVTGGNVIGVTGGSCNSSAFDFAPGAGAATTNSVLIKTAGGQWTCGGLTETAGSGSIYAEFNYGSTTPSATAPVVVNGACAVSGTLNVIVTGGIGWSSGVTYPLLQIVGSAPASINLNLVSTPNGVIGGSLSYDSGTQIISYTAGSAPRSLTWNTGNGLWDINTTANWLDTSLIVTKFQQLDLPMFNDAPGTGNFIVTNNSAVNPSSVTVSNSVANYTIAGSGSIIGNGALTKTGSGSLTLATVNAYSGGTVVSNGTLVLASSTALGSSTLDIEGGSLDSGAANLVNANNNPVTLDSDLIFLGSQNLNLGSGVISFTANRQIAVSNNTLTVSGSLSASGLTLTKSGPGTLKQGAANALGGVSLAVNQGVVDLNGATLGVNGFSGTTNGTVLNNAGSGQATLTIGNGNGGGTFNGTVADNSTGSGTLAVAKVGTGSVTWTGSNSYSGNTTITGGGNGCLFAIANPFSFGNTNGEVTQTDDNNSVRLQGNIMFVGKTVNIRGTGGGPSGGNGNGALQGAAGQTNVWAGRVRLGASGSANPARLGVYPGLVGELVVSGPLIDGLTASGASLGLVVNCDTTGSAVLISTPAGINTYSGQTAIGRGTLLLGATNTLPLGTVLNVGSAGTVSAVFDLNGFDQAVGGLTKSGANTSTILNSSLINTNTLTINQSITTTYSGGIAGGTALNLVKTGSGQLTLLGDTSAWNGLTTVSNGILLADNPSGSTGSGNVSVYGGTLGGKGNIAGSVSVYAGGTLAPGSNSLETLTIGGDLTLSSGSTSTFQVDGDTSANSQVSVSGNVTYGGGLNLVTNGTFSLGQTFSLFTGGNTASTPSNFSSISGSPGTGLAWSFTNGVLSVVAGSTYASYPTNITAAVSGSQITLTWPTTHLGWILQVQTNALSMGLTTPTNTWFDVTGSESSNTNVISINAANPAVFYRLRLP